MDKYEKTKDSFDDCKEKINEYTYMKYQYNKRAFILENLSELAKIYNMYSELCHNLSYKSKNSTNYTYSSGCIPDEVIEQLQRSYAVKLDKNRYSVFINKHEDFKITTYNECRINSILDNFIEYSSSHISSQIAKAIL